MFEGSDASAKDSASNRRPSVGTVLILLLLLGFFANAALFRVASDAARWIPDHPVLSPLRGGHEPGGFSTDAPSAARVSFRPQRGATILPIGSFRTPGWMPPGRTAGPRSDGRRCTVPGEST
jgi:hypothetical protein